MSLQDLASPCIVLIYARPGHGKTTLIKKYLKKLDYHSLYIVSASVHDDYSPVQMQELGVQPVVATDQFDWDSISQFRAQEGVKVIVLDDILHIESTGHVATQIRDLFSTSRHHNLYIFVGVQLLKTMGKALRYCCHVFMAGSIDPDSLELLTVLSGKKKSDFVGIHLAPHHFLFASSKGVVKKIVPTVSHPVYIDDSQEDKSETSETE